MASSPAHKSERSVAAGPLPSEPGRLDPTCGACIAGLRRQDYQGETKCLRMLVSTDSIDSLGVERM
jgi:hypothetical protein